MNSGRRREITASTFTKYYMPEPMSGCWLWLRCVSNGGYGKISLSTGTWDLAHRVSWRVHCGPIPEGLFVCHKCDNPPCVNPDHLFLGTLQDNAADMVAKGRGTKGQRHYQKLTEWQVREILASTKAHAALAAQHGVSRSTVSAIKVGTNWNALWREHGNS